MKTLIHGIAVLLLTSIVAAGQQTSDPMPVVVSSYLEIQAHLAADRFENVKAPARVLAAQGGAMGKAGEGIAKAAAALEAAGDLKAARDAFGPLSDAVIARVQAASGKEAADLRVAYCPMVKRSWLQRDGQIRNPYYGSQMLTCGELKPLKK